MNRLPDRTCHAYMGALFVLFLTPGPMRVAGTLTGGFRAGCPLVPGVAAGDSVWPHLAVLGSRDPSPFSRAW